MGINNHTPRMEARSSISMASLLLLEQHMVCQLMALLMEPSRLKSLPLQLLLDRKLLKVVKPPLMQKSLPRKKRW